MNDPLRSEWEDEAFIRRDIERASQAFGEDESSWAAFAKDASDKHFWTAAAARWKEFVRRFPNNPGGVANYADILIHRVGDLAEAEDVLAEGVKKFPKHILLSIYFAQNASSRLDWSVAIRRWEYVEQLSPNHPYVKPAIGEARMGRSVDMMEGKSSSVIVSPGGRREPWEEYEAAIENMFEAFESLGDNCEFGLVQRHFGCEPIGLMRWNSSQLDSLIDAFRHDFAKVGDPEYLRLIVSGGEYQLHDSAYGWVMHTFLKENRIKEPADALLAKLTRRHIFLKKQLRSDLQEGGKIFVFKSSDQDLFNAKILAEQIRKYGRSTFLYVTPASSCTKIGHVEVAESNMLHGFIDRFVLDGNWGEISFEVWKNICTHALRLRETLPTNQL